MTALSRASFIIDAVTSRSVRYDIAIVGAGAAGLTAAIFAARAAPGMRIVALEGAKKLGAKILISGGGRCNVTHERVEPADFNGNRNAIGKVLRSFPVEETVAFFHELGVELKREESGKLFPVTDRALTVLDALVGEAERRGVEIRSDARVERIDESFALWTAAGKIDTKLVILATGGRSVPKTGSDGRGYDLARALGHTVTETFPALVPLILEEGYWMRTLSGTSVEAELSVIGATGGVMQRVRGSLLLTHFGLSGPAALDISRHWIQARRHDPAARLAVNFLPGQTFESVEERLMQAAKRNAQATASSALRGEIPERILATLSDSKPLARLTREERRRLVHALVASEAPVLRDRGFDYAEVTAGGIPLSEVELATMASRRRPGLFLCGEILDVDGRIGGFNFQWAWASGRLAGLGTARAAREQT